jgi:O-methyltransferase/8-demethyl-8-(2,3-dimethoxy-alpha-L-rhamnosyl)tetracenomycin-C 4'-O-methyltransferase
MNDPVADLTWAALSSKETVRASYEIALAAISAKVPGDFVECGVFAGSNAAAMARAIRWHSGGPYDRRVHLFDSFVGVPSGGPHDEGWTHPEGVSACSRAQVEEYMRAWNIPSELLHYHEGLFLQTVPFFAGQFAATGGKIAVLRLDGDLYESTRVCLEQLYPLVSVGGWVIVDDWNLPGCRKAVDEYFGGAPPAPVYFHKNA